MDDTDDSALAEFRRTPGLVVVGLALTLFAAATPILIELHAWLANKPGKQGIGIFFGWLFLGVAAGLIGIICTFIGTKELPRTWVTYLAVLIASIEAFVGIFGLLSML